MRRCTKCKNWKMAWEFSGDRGCCKLCDNQTRQAYRAAHIEEERAHDTERYWNHREKKLAYSKTYYQDHRDELNARNKMWCKEHPEEARTHKKTYRQKNRSYFVAHCAGRKAAQKQRTLKLVNPKEIEAFYIEADRLTKETGVRYSVDHIVPLQGKLVSGFHVPWNLRVITFLDNSKKGNRFGN